LLVLPHLPDKVGCGWILLYAGVYRKILIERIADSAPECQRDVIALSPDSAFSKRRYYSAIWLSPNLHNYKSVNETNAEASLLSD
jgi:hypothetical protein